MAGLVLRAGAGRHDDGEFRCCAHPEWAAVEGLDLPVVSALLVPLEAGGATGVLVCTHPVVVISTLDVELATQFSPVASQILQFSQLRSARTERDLLESRVEERTEQLRGALSKPKQPTGRSTFSPT